MNNLRILTLNTWGLYGPSPEKRWTLLQSRVKELSADIVCLQEVFDGQLRQQILNAFQHPHSLEGSLSSGLMILSGYEFEKSYNVTFERRGSADNVDRSFIAGEINAPAGRLLITNTHLSWKAEETDIRHHQTHQLAEFVHNRKSAALLCGDFNCEYSSSEMKPLRSIKAGDTMQSFPDADRPTWDNRNPYIQSHRAKFKDRRVDLILDYNLNNNFRIISSEIVLNLPDTEGIYPSDHYGVMVSLIKNQVG